MPAKADDKCSGKKSQSNKANCRKNLRGNYANPVADFINKLGTENIDNQLGKKEGRWNKGNHAKRNLIIIMKL